MEDFQGWLYHKVHIFLESHSVCPLVRIGAPHPLSRKHVWRGGGVPIRTTGEKP